MDMDAHKVNEIIKNNPRFASPFTEGCGYYISEVNDEGIVEKITDKRFVELYWTQLQYAEKNIDVLVQKGFQACFFDFYGVNKGVVKSPNDMCQRLRVDTFVLIIRNNVATIASCLSNDEFMFGHFIEYQWDCDWNMLSSYIC